MGVCVQVLLTFGVGLIPVERSCVPGMNWQGYAFGCSFLPDSVKMIGSQSDSTQQGAALEIAMVSMQADSSVTQVVELSATILSLRLGDPKSSSTILVEDTVSVAAFGRVSIFSAHTGQPNRKLRSLPKVGENYTELSKQDVGAVPRRMQQSSLSSDSFQVYGDVNGDDRFTMDDITLVQKYILGESTNLSELGIAQRRHLDPTLDHLRPRESVQMRLEYDDQLCRPQGQGTPCPTQGDLLYLMRARLGQFVFLDVESSTSVLDAPLSPTSNLTATARFLDQDSNPKTSMLAVFFELNNANIITTTGVLGQETNAGRLVQAVHVGNGYYSITVSPITFWSGTIGVVISFETIGATTNEENERHFAFYNTQRGPFHGPQFDAFASFDAPRSSPTSALSESPTGVEVGGAVKIHTTSPTTPPTPPTYLSTESPTSMITSSPDTTINNTFSASPTVELSIIPTAGLLSASPTTNPLANYDVLSTVTFPLLDLASLLVDSSSIYKFETRFTSQMMAAAGPSASGVRVESITTESTGVTSKVSPQCVRSSLAKCNHLPVAPNVMELYS